MDESAWRLYRSAGTLLITSADVSELAEQDILDSLLLAELVATKKHDPYEAPSLWRKTWSQTMAQLHWAATASTGQEEEHAQPCTLASLLAQKVDASPELNLTTVLASMGTAQVKTLESFCTRHHADSTRLRFSVGLAHCAHTIQLSSVAFDVAAPRDDHWLSHEYAATVRTPLTVTRTSTTLALTSDYAQERSKVIDSLGNHRSREIERIHQIIKS